MGVRFGRLAPRQLEALRAELADALAAQFAYPAFFDYRARRGLSRPLDRAKRQEITTFLQTLSFAPIGGFQVDAPETQRYLEGLFVRYMDANPDLAGARQERRRGEMRARARRAASETQRAFLAYLAGNEAALGGQRPPRSWADAMQSSSADAEERAEHNTAALVAILARSPAHMPAPADVRPHIGARQGPPPAPLPPPASDDPAADARVFSQLRAQIEAYIRRAARGYGLSDRGGDPARVLDELRSSGLVDEANLSIAERILALADRVMAGGPASIEDYRQALALYLLYHRSHLSS